MLRHINEEEENGRISEVDRNLPYINRLMAVKHGEKSLLDCPAK